MVLTRRGIAEACAGGMSVAALLGPSAALASDRLDGFWMDSDGEVVLEIHKCDENLAVRCGRVAWLRLPNGPDGKPITDYRNPDTALRARPVCGMTALSGFKEQPDGTWSDGSVYVSDLGMSFSGKAEVLGPTEVRVSGFVLLPIFGQSEVWSKVTKPFTPCWVPVRTDEPADARTPVRPPQSKQK